MRRLTLLLLAITTVVPLHGATHYASNPVVVGESLFLASDGVSRYDIDSPTPRWNVLGGQQTFAPVAWRGYLLVSGSRGLQLLDQQQGRVVWHYRPGTTLFPATLHDNTAYLAGRDGSLSAVDLVRHRELWRSQLTGWLYPPAVVGERLVSGGSDGTLWALDRHTGEPLWEVTIGQELVYRPVPDDTGHLIVTTFDREVIAIDRGGREVWRRQLPAIVTSPISSGGLLYLNGLDHHVYALDPTSGKTRWRHRFPSPLHAQPALVGNQLIVIDREGGRYHLDATTGRRHLTTRLPGEPVGETVDYRGKALTFTRQRESTYPQLAI